MKTLLKTLAWGTNAALTLMTLVFVFWGIGIGSGLLSPLLMQHQGMTLWGLPLCIGLYGMTLVRLYKELELGYKMWPTMLFFGLCAQLLAASSGALMFAQQYTGWVQVVVPLACLICSFVASAGLLVAGVLFGAHATATSVADRVASAYQYGVYLRRLVREDRSRFDSSNC